MSNSFSGAENVAITIINNSKEYCESAYYCPSGPIKEVLKANDIKYYECKNIFTLATNINKVIKDFQPNIIHAHDYYASYISAYNKFNIPVISHLHNDPPFIKRKGILASLYLHSSKHYKKIITVSKNVINQFVFSNKIKEKFVVMDNPIDTKLIIKKSKENICQKHYDVIFVGRLVKLKEPIRYCEIAKKVLQNNPKVKFAIVGDGPLIDDIKKFIEANNLEQSIDVLGKQINPYSFMANSKLLCMVSQREGFPLVACEALCLGKPVVATPVGGLNKLITKDVGYLCKNNEDFISKINLLLNDRNVYNNFSKNSKNYIISNFDSSIFIKKLIKIYEESLAKC